MIDNTKNGIKRMEFIKQLNKFSYKLNETDIMPTRLGDAYEQELPITRKYVQSVFRNVVRHSDKLTQVQFNESNGFIPVIIIGKYVRTRG